MGCIPSPDLNSNDSALERRVADLTILCEVSRALQKTLDEDKTLYTILTGVTHGRGLGFNRAFLLLPDARGEYLVGRMAIGPSSPREAAAIWQELRGRHQNLAEILENIPPSNKRDLRVNEIVSRISIPLGQSDSAIARLIESREACLASGGIIQPHGWALDPVLTNLLETDTLALAPLHQSGRNLGLLLADNAITRAPIAVANLRLLQIYAQAAGAALQNALLYSELTDKVAKYENANRALRESQNQLLQAERLSTMGKMAALLAHEIRTPLVTIGGFARRLTRKTPSEDSRKEEVEIIISEVARLERLVEEVLGYTRIGKPDFEPLDMNELIRSVISAMEDSIQRGSVHPLLELDPALPEVTADKAQMRQLLMNLIVNALDAMPSGGVLTVRTTCAGEYMEIGIADTGVGIDREYWDRLFKPFFTTKSTGTGLGLAVVSQITENHRGSIRLESAPGEGSTFYVRLALRPERANPEPGSTDLVHI